MPKLALSDVDRDSSDSVAGRYYASLIGQNQDGSRSFYRILYVSDPLCEILLLAYQRRHQLGIVDFAAGHGIEMSSADVHVFFYQFFGVVDDSDDAYGVGSQLGTYQQRLRI